MQAAPRILLVGYTTSLFNEYVMEYGERGRKQSTQWKRREGWEGKGNIHAWDMDVYLIGIDKGLE